MKYIFILFIKIYQTLFSLDHGIWARILPGVRICLFYPSCSEYSKQALHKHGLFVGGYLSLKRVLRCGPWSWNKDKWDPVK
jgi:putative membrane protein insertion efficiency factor